MYYICKFQELQLCLINSDIFDTQNCFSFVSLNRTAIRSFYNMAKLIELGIFKNFRSG